MQMMRLIIEFAPAWVVAVASIIGLKTWKKQHSYKRKISIVDDIYAEVNHFLLKAHSVRIQFIWGITGLFVPR